MVPARVTVEYRRTGTLRGRWHKLSHLQGLAQFHTVGDVFVCRHLLPAVSSVPDPVVRKKGVVHFPGWDVGWFQDIRAVCCGLVSLEQAGDFQGLNMKCSQFSPLNS